MKLKLVLAALFLSVISLSAKDEIKGDDSRITYIGRTAIQDGTVSFDWSGVTAKIAFSGTSLSLKCEDTKTDYFNVWVDKEPSAKHDFVIKTAGDTCIQIVEKLKKGNHEVIIQKRTEGEQGAVTFKSLTTDGTFIQASGRKNRHIEFIGDSYSCGYGTEASGRNEPFRGSEENCNLSYDCIIGRYFDADVSLICHSGLGVQRNYGSNKEYTTMTVKYSQTFDMKNEDEWNPAFGGYRPDIVVIYLGTNDFSTSLQPSLKMFCDNYSTLLGKVRSYYGEDVPILCVASKANELMATYVKEAVRRCNIANVTWTAIFDGAHNDSSDLGASWHPNYVGMRKVASCMIPYIATATGWDMPFKAIE